MGGSKVCGRTGTRACAQALGRRRCIGDQTLSNSRGILYNLQCNLTQIPAWRGLAWPPRVLVPRLSPTVTFPGLLCLESAASIIEGTRAPHRYVASVWFPLGLLYQIALTIVALIYRRVYHQAGVSRCLALPLYTDPKQHHDKPPHYYVTMPFWRKTASSREVGFDPTFRYATSWILPPGTLFACRALLSLYAFVTIFFIFGWNGTHDRTRESERSFSYFTNLTYWGLAFYYLFAAIHTISYWKKGTPFLAQWPRFLQIAHGMFYSTVVVFPWIVTSKRTTYSVSCNANID